MSPLFKSVFVLIPSLLILLAVAMFMEHMAR